jgi:hypothetical protein
MLVSELTQTYLPLYPDGGGDWSATVEYLYSEEPHHMQELSEDLQAGGWRDPVIISEPDDPWEDALRVKNGTHRVAIALREGVVSLPVTTWSNLEEVDSFYTELTVKLIGPALADEESEGIFECLRSFPVTTELWVNSDVCYGSLSRWTLLYNLADKNGLALLKKRVRARLSTAFPERSFRIAAKLVDLDVEDEEAAEE